ncbi:hypothetical protein [Limnobacter litoralis]|uniref:Uncharacterized protein n=1 Tax=Limnobacter litoralis TaxID=481366 RepID=A0ABQ5YSU9_9BURK|nr:hypothetical protein [Limnobacter litoralis]GLR26351.1 hypothetical protein GCM10007875_14410 [Limnobacter litoralis]
MSSIAERLTRAYCLFHWLQVKPIPEQIRQSLAFKSLEQELLALKVRPEDLAAVGSDVSDSFEESRLAFMVRYSGLTWSTCSVFCDSIDHRDWLRLGAPLLVRFNGIDMHGQPGLPNTALGDFAFLNPSKVWVEGDRIMSFVVRWNKLEVRRMERFLRLAGARHGVEATINQIEQSEKFIAAIKATVGV